MNLDPELLQAFIEESMDYLSGWEKSCLELEKSESTQSLDSLFRTAHSLKGTSRCVGTSIGLKAFGDYMHEIENLLNIIQSQERKTEKFVIDLFLECETTIRLWLNQIISDPDFTPSTEKTIEKIREAISFYQATVPTAMPPEQTNETKIIQINEEIKVEFEEEIVVKQIKKNQTTETIPNKAPDTIRVSFSKLDSLIQMVGELSIHQSIVWHAKQTNNLDSNTTHNSIILVNKITKELQAQTMSLRMQPLQPLFQKLERVARDVARETGKAIEVKIKGEDVELDKSIIDGIGDPLVHVLRNAVDHGIETIPEREQNGKPLMASILITAEQDADGVIIKISDDGKGLNTEKIKQKALERKIISKNACLSTLDIHQLIFQPGFSTAEQVTKFSGRGVGMDVVKKAIDTLGGDIKIYSKEGEGTTFNFLLPTSMSILEALVVALSGIKYAVPIQHLAEIIDSSQFKIEVTAKKEKMLSLRGEVLPLQDLQDYLPKKQNEVIEFDKSSKNRPALVIKDGQDRVAFSVDSILGQQQIVVRQLNQKLKDVHGFCGGTILSNGEPGLIIDLPSIAKEYLEATKYPEK